MIFGICYFKASSKNTTLQSSSNSKQISSASFFGKSAKQKKEGDNGEGNSGASSTKDKVGQLCW